MPHQTAGSLNVKLGSIVMGDLFHSLDSRISSEAASSFTSRKDSKLHLVVSAPVSLPHVSLQQVPLFKKWKIKKGPVSDVAFFLLKVGALEAIRRLSKAWCPFLWSGLQAFEILCFPPFKWLQRWNPFKNLIKGVQIFSRPLLVLSIATAFSDQSGCDDVISDDTENSQYTTSESSAVPDSHTIQSIDGESLPNQPSTNWLLQLYDELEKQGVSLPERINVDELCRFHFATNGDFLCLVSSVKKAIRWRETYKMLSEEELKVWSSMVFWHGYDVKNRPCLIVRLVACIKLPSSERTRFAQAIVSQVEHGILHLINKENPEITVLVDCEGLSLRFPMQLLRSCCAILQENYPGRLGCLFVIRLPPVVRVIAQTFIQVLKPATRQKLKIIGRIYRNALSEYLESLPSYLGGECTCLICVKLSNSTIQVPQFDEVSINRDSNTDRESIEDLQIFDENYQMIGVFRSAVVGILIVSALIVLISQIAPTEVLRGMLLSVVH